MSILADKYRYSCEGKKCPRDEPFLQFGLPSKKAVALGLINNMPDMAIERTERQFFRLLDAAAQLPSQSRTALAPP
jgi:hypothetical protein